MGTEVPSGPGQYSDAHAASVGSHLMEIEAVDRWMEAYKAAWISNVPTEVAALFTEDAVYAVSPFAESWTGRDEIVRRWVAGIRQDVDMMYEVLSDQGDNRIIHCQEFRQD